MLNDSDDDLLVMTGLDLIDTMIDDWKFSDTPLFTDYFPQVSWIEKDKMYRINPEVTYIEQIDGKVSYEKN